MRSRLYCNIYGRVWKGVVSASGILEGAMIASGRRCYEEFRSPSCPQLSIHGEYPVT